MNAKNRLVGKDTPGGVLDEVPAGPAEGADDGSCDNDGLAKRLIHDLTLHTGQAKSLHGMLADYSDDFYFWLLNGRADSGSVLADIIPLMPSESFQKHYTGSSGEETLREAYIAYGIIKRLAEANGVHVSRCKSILDFGCGWGRTIRFFLKDVETSVLHGADIDKTMIDICSQSNLNCSFSLIDPVPPVGFDDNSMDIIYLYSVFTHLSEEVHLKWLEEFKRILRPGGIVIATTRPRAFILLCADLRKQGFESWQRCAANAFPEVEEALAVYDRGGFCHTATGGGVVHDKSFFGESCIPKSYVQRVWGRYFSFVDHMDDTDLRPYYQDVIIARK